MFQVERRNYIVKYLNEHGSLVVEELAKLLDVTPMTIRRDLKFLEETGIIAKTFGGAVLRSTLIEEIPYKEKTESNTNQKIEIAQYASTLVSEGDTIILDAGTTTMEIAKKIKDIKGIRVITNDLIIAAYLSNFSYIEVLCTGGTIQSSTGACLGTRACEFFQNIIADMAFIGTSSIDVEKGISTPTFDKAELKKSMINSAERTILVSDSSKFGKKSFAKICSLNELDLIITDNGLDPEILRELKDKKIKIKTVDI